MINLAILLLALATASAENLERISSTEALDTSSWESDPFLKPAGQEPISSPGELEHIKLQGTMTDPQRPLAIINQKTYRVGDILEDRKIKEIGDSYIVLEKSGSLIEISLNENTDESKGVITPGDTSPRIESFLKTGSLELPKQSRDGGKTK